MIVGIGLDVCEIARMEEYLKNTKFLERYFSLEERTYILDKGQMAPASMAGIFAAKEALVKALGTGFNHTSLFDIVIQHDPLGAPFYELRGSYAQHAAQKNITNLHLSITHEGNIAAAVAIAERNQI